MNLFVAVAASYLLVAALGFILGRISGEIIARETHSWPALPELGWPEAIAPYDWDQEGTLP